MNLYEKRSTAAASLNQARLGSTANAPTAGIDVISWFGGLAPEAVAQRRLD